MNRKLLLFTVKPNCLPVRNSRVVDHHVSTMFTHIHTCQHLNIYRFKQIFQYSDHAEKIFSFISSTNILISILRIWYVIVMCSCIIQNTTILTSWSHWFPAITLFCTDKVFCADLLTNSTSTFRTSNVSIINWILSCESDAAYMMDTFIINVMLTWG